LVVYHSTLGIPLSALVSIIFGMMLVSFPLGAYVVFETDIGEQITHQIPASEMSVFGVGQYEYFPPYIEMGDVFMAAWTAYLIVFAVAVMGPDRDVTVSMKDMVYGRRSGSNYMMHGIVWFSVLVLVSGVIESIQGRVGLTMAPPDIGNDLVQFHLITLAPITEEILFRVALVGLPVFALYTHRTSLAFLVKCLWHPARYLHIYDTKKMLAVVLAAGIVFGAVHVLSGDTWGAGKAAQAAAAGIILGYAYCRYGLACAVLIHWASNYFLYSYGSFVAHLGDWDIAEAFAQPFFDTVQLILLAAGAIGVSAMIMGRLIPRQSPAAD
jgi:membrane protease YdiL (CAAX protease family)